MLPAAAGAVGGGLLGLGRFALMRRRQAQTA